MTACFLRGWDLDAEDDDLREPRAVDLKGIAAARRCPDADAERLVLANVEVVGARWELERRERPLRAKRAEPELARTVDAAASEDERLVKRLRHDQRRLPNRPSCARCYALIRRKSLHRRPVGRVVGTGGEERRAAAKDWRQLGGHCVRRGHGARRAGGERR